MSELCINFKISRKQVKIWRECEDADKVNCYDKDRYAYALAIQSF